MGKWFTTLLFALLTPMFLLCQVSADGLWAPMNNEYRAAVEPSGSRELQQSYVWARLDRLQAVYHQDDFFRDFSDQIQPANICIPIPATAQGVICGWSYPGSGLCVSRWELTPLSNDQEPDDIRCGLVFTDPNGGQWGFRNGKLGWVYLDDLYTENPPGFVLQAENTVTDTGHERSPILYTLTLPIVLTAAVVAVTSTAVILLKRKRRP